MGPGRPRDYQPPERISRFCSVAEARRSEISGELSQTSAPTQCCRRQRDDPTDRLLNVNRYVLTNRN